ncbi:hypothetical protein [uncultured Psychrobacter sp.]|uniref:hypothetical protein n=1 Tax=uncultured Psychrobacter sp. TaxID=259303 RepID=UPI0025960B72|nr:hypothetical protein [uncultured Psychrobacter sp.]
MGMRLTSILLMAAAGWALVGCDQPTEVADPATEQAAVSNDGTAQTSAPAAYTIDWSSVASGEKPADRSTYEYPFAIDSQNVLDYAEYFDVDAATAQHNLTISMASNEALSKALDQLSETYVSHELTDGNEMTLVIHTTPDVAASRYDYVLSDDFAKGLVLPIVIKPDGKKGDAKAHGEMAE